MFWHCHLIDGRIITHSHVYWGDHAGASFQGAQNPGKLQLLDILSHIVYTDKAVLEFNISRIEVLENVAPVPEVVAFVDISPANSLDLRGPPALI